MNRIATTLTTLTASVLSCLTLGAAEPKLQALEARLTTLETRLISLEEALSGESNSYTYNNAATLEATKGTESRPASTAPTAAAPATTTGQTYVIQDGDTLGKIATKFSIERKTLLEANRLSEGQPIYIGETLLIPGALAAKSGVPAPADKTVKNTTAPVQSGTVADAGKPAPVKQDSIVVGETKKNAPASTTLHTVAKGDTLTAVAKKYNTSVESLKSANGLRSDSISLGQTLKIPSAKTPAASQASATTPVSAPQNKPKQSSDFEYDNPLLSSSETYGYYTVAKGDNLYALARDFFTTMSELQRINHLGSSTTIFPGNDIIVPTSKYNAYHKTGEMATR